MSRSVKPDYDKLRTTPHHVYMKQGGTVSYIGVTIPMTDEQIFTHIGMTTDQRFERKGISLVVAPTNEDWAKYHRAKSGLLSLQNYEATIGAEEVEIPIPKPETRFAYTETHEEWLARCHTLQAERKAA